MKRFKTSHGFYITIGLEIHIALTGDKLLSRMPTQNVGLLDIATPGVLPVVSTSALQKAIAFGLAVDAEFPECMGFERKHYWYGDLPLGYQITQERDPIVRKGHLSVWDAKKQTFASVFLDHAHLEVDAAKSVHHKEHSTVELERCGTALIEVVTKPCIHEPYLARIAAEHVMALCKYSSIAPAKMEDGTFRVDVSISISKELECLGPRVEIKGIASLGAIDQAIAFEIQRQQDRHTQGLSVESETRQWDDMYQETRSMREKESRADYRFMPEPDIPMLDTSSLWFKEQIDIAKKTYAIDYHQTFGVVQTWVLQELHHTDLPTIQRIMSPSLQTWRMWMQASTLSEKEQSTSMKSAMHWWPEVVQKLECPGLEFPLDLVQQAIRVGASTQAIKDAMVTYAKDPACVVEFRTSTLDLNSQELNQWLITELQEPSVLRDYQKDPQKIRGYLTGRAKKKWGPTFNIAQLHAMLDK